MLDFALTSVRGLTIGVILGLLGCVALALPQAILLGGSHGAIEHLGTALLLLSGACIMVAAEKAAPAPKTDALPSDLQQTPVPPQANPEVASIEPPMSQPQRQILQTLPSDASRTARIFLSSTFRDYAEERDLLVRRVFPGLRARLKDRAVELVDVDLRWGITAEQAERGEVLPICLAEIDRARPYFIGMLGERYGWIPPADAYAADLLERQGWLDQHRGGKSVTELEILHGVLNDPAMAGRAFFYFRAKAYAERKGGDYLAASPEDTARQADLKARISESGFPVAQYSDPEDLASRLEQDLWQILDAAYPADQVPDAFEREGRRHAAYAAPRRRLYLGGEHYIAALDTALADHAQRVLIEGASGGGKSALLANWLARHKATNPNDLVHEHFLAASADAADAAALVRRLIETIKRRTDSNEEIPSEPDKLFEILPLWLGLASAYARHHDKRWLVVLDGLNGLRSERDLRWLPEFLPERVHLAVSCLPGEVMEAITTKGDWRRVHVEPLSDQEGQTLLRRFLSLYNKALAAPLEAQVLAHPLASNPLFLRTLAEELRLFGVHEQLAERLGYYLASTSIAELFGRVLERVEGDAGADAVRATMTAIWASRAGLSEQEILGLSGLVPAHWAPIRYALDEALLESGGRLSFAHDYLRAGVAERYLGGDLAQREAHVGLAAWFEQQPVDARAAEEVPYQWQAARDWERLKACLTRREMFEALDASTPNEEMLAYWLVLEREDNADLERDYEAAWKRWAPDEGTEATGDTAASLGQFLLKAGRFKEFTEYLLRSSMAILEKALGPEHTKTGGRLSNLAVFVEAKGDYVAAEPLYRRALAIAEKAHGPEHPETGRRLGNLVILLKAKGDYVATEPLVRRALAIAEKAQGPGHPDTGRCLNILAELLRERGDYATAEPLVRRALAITEKAQGVDHLDTASALNNLALLLLVAKADYAAAEPLLRRALAITEKNLGPEHPSTGTSLVNLAALLRANGDYATAEPLYRRGLAIREKALGPEHPSTGTSLNNLALLLYDKGNYAAAEPLLRRALAIAEKALGPEHQTTSSTMLNLVELLRAKGEHTAAEPLARRALAIAEKVLGPEHPSTGTSLNNLALLLYEKGNYAVAEPLYRRALAIAEKVLGPEHPSTTTILNNLAGLLQTKGDYAAAEPVFRRALAITEKALGPEHPDTGLILNNLASLLRDQGDYAAAEPLYRRALAITEKAFGPKHPSTITIKESLVGLLKQLSRKAIPDRLLSRGDFLAAIAAAKKILRAANSDTLTIIGFLAGAASAADHVPIWAEDLQRRIDDATRAQIRRVVEQAGLRIQPADSAIAAAAMPLDDEFKQLLAEHPTAPFEDFVALALAQLSGEATA